MSTFEIKKILVPVDFSGTGEKVLEQVVMMAEKTKSSITLLTVLDGPLSNAGPDLFGLATSDGVKYEDAIMGWVKQHMEAFKKKLHTGGASNVDYIVEKGSAYKKIVATAQKINADIIVMGTHGVSGVREFVVGSNAFRVVSEAQCPVLTIQKHITKPGFKDILLPFRDKAHSREKVDYAIDIANLYGASIHVLGISYDTDPSEVKKIQLEADQTISIIKKAGVNCTEEVIEGDYKENLIFEHAKMVKADLIIAMSDLDKMEISEFVSGPFIQHLVNHSNIPVLSIRPKYNPNPVHGTGENVGDWSFWG
jgi:nucleotide-binding universal stress UspA family protein